MLKYQCLDLGDGAAEKTSIPNECTITDFILAIAYNMHSYRDVNTHEMFHSLFYT